MSGVRSTAPWVVAARDLYLVAMAIFVVTIGIGILNGADAVTFDRNQILTHVHSGTIGWLTLAIVASAFLLFRAADRRLMLTLAVLVPVYVAAFYTGSFPARAITGLALLVAIGWLLTWLWQQFLRGERTLPRLAVILGLSSFGYGAVIGVVIQLQLAMGRVLLPGDSIGAHASAMTFGYLALVAMGLIEWRLRDTRGLPRAGVVQVGALFAGGLIVSVGLLAGATQIAGGLYLLTNLVAIVLFVARIWPTSLRASWLEPGPRRLIALASIWVVVALLLFMYLVFTVVQTGTLLGNVLVGSDHAVYIGVITNIVLALLLALTASGDTRPAPWIGQLTFWGVNLGLAVFVVGLIAESSEIKRIGAPAMGIALLLSLAVLAARAWSSTHQESESAVAEPAR